MEFPAFRSADWIESTFHFSPDAALNGAENRFFVPAQILRNFVLVPQAMRDSETANIYKRRRYMVQEEMRRALFRQAIFKVQNVEVMYIKQCKKNRILAIIEDLEGDLTLLEKVKQNMLERFYEFYYLQYPKLLTKERWHIDRCGEHAHYDVRYFAEDGNGFSVDVKPLKLRDRLQAWRYELSSLFDTSEESGLQTSGDRGSKPEHQ